MLNKQIPIKQDLSSADSLSMNSIFYTIQGEGPLNGSPAIFIRLAGCNLQCPSCDTEYSHQYIMSVRQVIDAVVELMPRNLPVFAANPIVVITGGEPFRQNISKLINDLLLAGFIVQIETNGTLFVDLGWAFAHRNLIIVCSPKAGKINRDLERHIKAYKYVLNADSISSMDGLPILALSHSASPQVARPSANFTGEVFIQPIDVQDDIENARHLQAAVQSSLRFGYRLCLQVHKIIGVA